MLRILLVDDHQLLREMLTIQLAQLEESPHVYQASSEREALDFFERVTPDLILTDIELREGNGFDLISQVRSLQPGCKFMVLSGYDYDAYVERALQEGVNGYVVKSDGIAILKEAIRTVIRGQPFFSESIRKRIETINGRMKLVSSRSPAVAMLTRREKELLTHLGMGASLKEAAAVMDVSYKTADNQKTSLMRKLNIHDRVELARFAIREGLVSA